MAIGLGVLTNGDFQIIHTPENLYDSSFDVLFFHEEDVHAVDRELFIEPSVTGSEGFKEVSMPATDNRRKLIAFFRKGI